MESNRSRFPLETRVQAVYESLDSSRKEVSKKFNIHESLLNNWRASAKIRNELSEKYGPEILDKLPYGKKRLPKADLFPEEEPKKESFKYQAIEIPPKVEKKKSKIAVMISDDPDALLEILKGL